MSVEKLVTKNFRNINDGSINFDSDCNFFIGENGSGKSSLLEALFFIGHGKSFRTNKPEHLVAHNEENFVLSIKDFDNGLFGISKDFTSNQTLIKINGERNSRLSELAKNIAIQVVTPESFRLFFGGPKERRRFVDLGLFHVEHQFSKAWSEFNRVLKQRNACLRNQVDNVTLNYWSDIFCQHSDIIAEYRKNYLDLLLTELSIWTKILLPDISSSINVQYIRGWKQGSTLSEVIKANINKEKILGYTINGTHKFDLKFLLNKNAIESQLSRGQQKLFLIALTFTQAKLIEKVKRLKPILLIDDVGAELDFNSRCMLQEAIKMLNCQVIITAIDKVAVEPLVPSNEKYKMFHVKHGVISAIDK
ncbi:MAG: DNA replication and repair protein RecF [Alteromonadaceae bacterium]|jgi:DNA replication and repair protein RecF